MKNNIILIGMPGAGKSTVGVICAKIINKKFVDTDLIIQRETKELLWKLIEKNGLENFLKLEEEIIISNSFENCVVATGGSVVYSEKAMEYLKSIGVIVYLNVPLSELERRIKNFSTRGIAAPKEMSLKEIYKKRCIFYQRYADITIDCSNLTLEQVADAVVECI